MLASQCVGCSVEREIYDFGTEPARNKSLLYDAQDKNGTSSIIQEAWEDIGKGIGCEDNFC